MIKPIAIYLPQYHTIPENDAAWGEGFTEWTNVKKAESLFDGHYQPHVPHESVGLYDLSEPEILIRQAAMAEEYGIYGFAYYHYWFNGKRLLETPLDNMLHSGKPDFPFLYIWANENWTKRWDGLEQEIIIKQDYSLEDDKEHLDFLCKNVFSDKRYIRIDEKPVFIVYRTELFPDIKETAKIWREVAKNNGYKDLYLVRVESFVRKINPRTIGFDAAMEFAPDWSCCNPSNKFYPLNCIDYPTSVFNMILKNYSYPVFRSVFPSWDNTARKNSKGTIFINNDIDIFRYYLQRIVEFTQQSTNKEKYIFINAWNEWGEGCHIEPDSRMNFKYLEVIKEELANNAVNSDFRNYIRISNIVQFLRKFNMIRFFVYLLKVSPSKRNA